MRFKHVKRLYLQARLHQFPVAMVMTLSVMQAALAQPTAPSEPQFAISKFEVSGNTLLAPNTVDARLTSFVGDERRFADIEAARRALEAMYLQAGYSTVQVTLPEQEISSGVIRLLVREMKLGSITLMSANHHDLDNVKASVPGLVEGQVPNTVAVAESLRLANDNPSKQTQLLFKPDPVNNRVDAVLRLEDEKPWKGFVSLDNTGTSDTGKTHLNVGYQHANLFNRDHVLTLQYITSVEKPQNMHIYGFGYRLPLYDRADAIDVYAGYSDVNSGTVAGLFNVSGKGKVLGARYAHQFVKTNEFEHKLSVGMDYRAYENNIDQNGTALGTDVTVHPFNLSWNSLWKKDNTQLNGYASWLHNLPGGSKGSDADFAATRSGAQASYQLLRLGGNASKQFAGDWQWRLALDAQYTQEPLVPGEQFGLGGQDSVRGFDERSVSGDRGWRTGLEIFSPDIGGTTGIAGARLRFSAFVEGGQVQRLQALPGETGSEGIASVGLGMRFGIDKSLSFRLDFGHVINGDASQNKGSDKLHGSMAYVF
ncbi:MAG: ShlB/FhaC/HecB family hemolysin secretion/activation protein [Rhodoferax sp.]|nr:ShlB/FhaC/HecB family hemolysin secretion/activation protein [Rhodoferax sp.]